MKKLCIALLFPATALAADAVPYPEATAAAVATRAACFQCHTPQEE